LAKDESGCRPVNIGEKAADDRKSRAVEQLGRAQKRVCRLDPVPL
jgi:hypothetical protein